MRRRRSAAAGRSQATTPYERLKAVIEGNFEERFFQSSICHAWLSLCAEVPREPQLARIQTVIHARMRSNLMSALVHLLPHAECETVALAITVLIDGLWLHAGLQSDGLNCDMALAQMQGYLDHRIPRLQMPRLQNTSGSLPPETPRANPASG